MNPAELKLVVKEKYGEIARQRVLINDTACCGTSGCCGELGISMIGDEYKGVEGHVPEADLGLGCGLPTQYAGIRKGDAILDLGSGAGNDCFVARSITGETGQVTGLDFTDEMLEKANRNVKKLGYTNISFVKGDIENIPLPDDSYDVVISNCVLNLVPDKEKAFSQIFRVLKTGGHFCISDVVLRGKLPQKLQEVAVLYAGCVAGAIQQTDYIDIITNSGFSDVQIPMEKQIKVPDEILLRFISKEDLIAFKASGTGVYSITVTASK